MSQPYLTKGQKRKKNIFHWENHKIISFIDLFVKTKDEEIYLILMKEARSRGLIKGRKRK